MAEACDAHPPAPCPPLYVMDQASSGSYADLGVCVGAGAASGGGGLVFHLVRPRGLGFVSGSFIVDSTEYWLWHSLREAGYGVPCVAMISISAAPSRGSHRIARPSSVSSNAAARPGFGATWDARSPLPSAPASSGLPLCPRRPHFPSLTPSAENRARQDHTAFGETPTAPRARSLATPSAGYTIREGRGDG